MKKLFVLFATALLFAPKFFVEEGSTSTETTEETPLIENAEVIEETTTVSEGESDEQPEAILEVETVSES